MNARDMDLTKPLDVTEVMQAVSDDALAPSPKTYAAPSDWPMPQALPQGLPDVTAFDADLLPDTLRPWLVDIAERMQCPLDFPAVGAMVALGAIVGQRLRIRPKRHDSWQEAPNLWGGIIGRPGAMKSPALSEALKPLKAIEGRALETAKADAAKIEIEEMEFKAREKALIAELDQACKPTKPAKAKPVVQGGNVHMEKLERGAPGGGRALDSIKQDLFNLKQAQTVAAIENTARRYTTNDPTVEKLGEILAANPNGILINRDELVGFMRNMDKPGHESDRSFYLESWNASGGRFIYDRIARGTVVIESPCTSVIGGTQPGVIGQYVREAASNGIGADGLMQRFQLLVWPDDIQKWSFVDRWADTPARQTARACYERLAELDPAGIGGEREKDSEEDFLRFDADAQEIFVEWLTAHEAELRTPQAECLNGHFSKYRKLIPALALLCHLADNPNGGPVGMVSTIRAIAWSEYLKSHALRVYASALGSGAAPAVALADRIRAGAVKDHFTARNVYLKNWQGLDKANTEKALEMLEELDWLRAVEHRNPKGGRPTVTYDINPRIKEAGV